METPRAGLDPPIPRDQRGEPRTVGVEIELTGLEVGAIAETVARLFDGKVSRETDYLARVATWLGEFRVEVDLHLLQQIGKNRAAHRNGAVVSALRDAVASVAELIAPLEVVTPPLPYTELPRVDELADALGAAGGRGTHAGLLQALGLHFNPQPPDVSAATIHSTIRAFAILEPWLRNRSGIDVSRKLTPFVDPYPAAYVERLLVQEVPPTMDRLISEYLRYNATRNRGLDALPLFASIDRGRVMAAVADPRIKARPTFHYRLPDSRVGEPGWRVTDEWRLWLLVEDVAASRRQMARLAEAYAATLHGTSAASAQHEWAGRCEVLLDSTTPPPA